MEKNNASYEVLFVVDLTPGEEGVKALVEKFTSLIAENGTVNEVNEWGKPLRHYLCANQNICFVTSKGSDYAIIGYT